MEYRSRPIRALGVHEVANWRLKVYSISAEGEWADPAMVQAAISLAEKALAIPTKNDHYGVGFLGIHDGRGENQVFLDRWINENELLHQYWISGKEAPSALRSPDADHNSVCVWDLFVQAYEREAWLKHVLRPGEADFEGYFADQFNGQV